MKTGKKTGRPGGWIIWSLKRKNKGKHMKYGISVKIDVTKLDKTRFFKGEKGIYADLTMFIDTEKTSEYGDNGTITQATSKEERQNGVKLPILGNAKIFYTDGSNDQKQQTDGEQYDSNQQLPEDDVPF